MQACATIFETAGRFTDWQGSHRKCPQVASEPIDLPRLRGALTVARLLGLSGPGGAEWAHLRVLQLGGMARSAQLRTIILLLPAILVASIATGRYSPAQVAGWATLWCALGWLAVQADQTLAQTHPGGLRLRHLWGHALVVGGSALAWAMPLVLTAPHANLVDHVGLAMVAALMVGALAFATPATPLATLVFAIALGAATITGLAMRGAWTYAGAAIAVFGMAGWAALEVARGHLATRLAEAELADRSKLVSLLLREFEEDEADWLWQIDTACRVRGVSPRFALALEQEPHAVEGRSFMELLCGSGWGTGACAPSLYALDEQLKLCRSFSDLLVQVDVGGKEHWWKLSGSPLIDAHGRFAGYRGVGSDVTEQRRTEKKIEFLARHDPLTGLPNRSRLIEALQDALNAVDRRGIGCAVLLIDLDRFKAVNDTLGHPVGDKLLVQVAARLREAVGRSGHPARLGGDEFAVVVPDLHAAPPEDVAEALIQHLSHPFEVDGHLLSIGASVGSACAPGDGACVDVLLRHADLALYRAKSDGRGIHCRYVPALRADAEQRRGLEQALRHAVAREELQLAFQPIVEASAERIIGFEALLRWHSEQHGAVAPDRYIPLAEKTRLIVPIGEWVLFEACREAARWPKGSRLAINVAGQQLLEPGFAALVARALADGGLPPHRLEIELTEGTLLRYPASALRTLEELARLGCALALDDFGTGTSSLGQLRQLNLSHIKIDRSFVRGAACGDAEGLAIVRAVVAMAQSIGMGTTAEGVESAEEAVLMRQFGCTRLQGYFYGRPMPAGEALALALASCQMLPPPDDPPEVVAA